MQKYSDDLANVLGSTLIGGAGGAGVGALAGAAYNGLFGKPQLFYDDLGRGALRGLLTGGGGGAGFGAAGPAGGRAGSLAGLLAGNMLVRRDEDDDEYLARLQTGEKKKKKSKTYMRSTAEKQSKVYEATESVDMPVKYTKMNHKKCTPGEFGAMVKESANPVFDLAKTRASADTGTLYGGLAGLVGGGLYGAYAPGEYKDLDANGKPTLKRRSRLMGALRGAAGYGLGGAAVGRLGGAVGSALHQYINSAQQYSNSAQPVVRAGQIVKAVRDPETGKVLRYVTENALGDAAEEMATKTVAAGKDLAKKTLGTGEEVATQTLGAAKDKLTDVASRGTGSDMADRALKTVADNIPTSTGDAVNKGLDITTKGLGALNSWLDSGRTKTNSAREFGAYVKQSFNIQQYLPAAGMGAGLGAGAGALSGLINPGEEDEYDDDGRVIGRKQRSRFGAMMRNALMGAGVGGLAGGAASHFAPNTTNAALQQMYSMFRRQQRPNVYPANTTDYAALDADPNSVLDTTGVQRVGMPQTSVPNPTAAEIPDLDAAGL